MSVNRGDIALVSIPLFMPSLCSATSPALASCGIFGDVTANNCPSVKYSFPSPWATFSSTLLSYCTTKWLSGKCLSCIYTCAISPYFISNFIPGCKRAVLARNLYSSGNRDVGAELSKPAGAQRADEHAQNTALPFTALTYCGFWFESSYLTTYSL